MKIRVLNTRLYVHDLVARMPFRYGIATMTHLPHLMIGVDVEIDGTIHQGQAAENLAPKWFTKDPNTTVEQDVEQMLGVIRSACRLAREIRASVSVFSWWRELYDAQLAASAQRGEPPLLAGLGASLVERA